MLAKLQEAAQYAAVSEQFVQQIEEKDHQIALLEQKIKKLLSTVRGSRQERINPNQLFSSQYMNLSKSQPNSKLSATWKKIH
jgi:hypothetical protein